MAQATCRVTPALESAIEDAATEAGLFRSDVIRRALVHYVRQNPDGLEVLTDRQIGSVQTVNTNENGGQPDSLSSGPYDPTTDR